MRKGMSRATRCQQDDATSYVRGRVGRGGARGGELQRRLEGVPRVEYRHTQRALRSRVFPYSSHDILFIPHRFSSGNLRRSCPEPFVGAVAYNSDDSGRHPRIVRLSRRILPPVFDLFRGGFGLGNNIRAKFRELHAVICLCWETERALAHLGRMFHTRKFIVLERSPVLDERRLLFEDLFVVATLLRVYRVSDSISKSIETN